MQSVKSENLLKIFLWGALLSFGAFPQAAQTNPLSVS